MTIEDLYDDDHDEPALIQEENAFEYGDDRDDSENLVCVVNSLCKAMMRIDELDLGRRSDLHDSYSNLREWLYEAVCEVQDILELFTLAESRACKCPEKANPIHFEAVTLERIAYGTLKVVGKKRMLRIDQG